MSRDGREKDFDDLGDETDEALASSVVLDTTTEPTLADSLSEVLQDAATRVVEAAEIKYSELIAKGGKAVFQATNFKIHLTQATSSRQIQEALNIIGVSAGQTRNTIYWKVIKSEILKEIER